MRASVTEPAVTLRFEARSQEELRAVMDRFLESAPELREAVVQTVSRGVQSGQSEEDS